MLMVEKPKCLPIDLAPREAKRIDQGSCGR
jgi:hypothetical protein